MRGTNCVIKRVWRQEAKLEAFAIVPVSGDEILSQVGVSEGERRELSSSGPTSVKCISFFPFCWLLSLQPFNSSSLQEPLRKDLSYDEFSYHTKDGLESSVNEPETESTELVSREPGPEESQSQEEVPRFDWQLEK